MSIKSSEKSQQPVPLSYKERFRRVMVEISWLKQEKKVNNILKQLSDKEMITLWETGITWDKSFERNKINPELDPKITDMVADLLNYIGHFSSSDIDIIRKIYNRRILKD